jgi:murein DD-endopeptidase MepM/ murein hydrolase activator NlpD
MKKNNNKRNLLLLIFGLISLKFLSKTKTKFDLSKFNIINKKIFSPYGIRSGSPHYGIDFVAKTGTKILLINGGLVEKIETTCKVTNPKTKGCGGGWGNYITINHGNNIKTRYAHLSKLYVKQGDIIKTPTIIAETGDTGNSTGSHLHWEYLENNKRINGTGKENNYFNFVI